MVKATIIRLDEVESVDIAPNSRYRPLVGDAEGTTPIRTGIQICEPGYVAATHSHPYLEILHILEGTAEVWLEGEENDRTRLETGDTVMLPPNVPHAFAAYGDRRMRLLGTHISPKRIVVYKDRETDERGYPVIDPVTKLPPGR